MGRAPEPLDQLRGALPEIEATDRPVDCSRGGCWKDKFRGQHTSSSSLAKDKRQGQALSGIMHKDSGGVDKVVHNADDALGRKVARTEDDSPTAVSGRDHYEDFWIRPVSSSPSCPFLFVPVLLFSSLFSRTAVIP